MKWILTCLFAFGFLAAFSAAVGYNAQLSCDERMAAAQERTVIHGTASWYSTAETHGRATASGERLDDGALTAAMWDVPFGTRLRVSMGGRSVVVRVNDRGPARRLVSQGRICDLTRAAFAKLAPLSRGVIPVTVERID
jgi:rare lipoprotein A